MKEFIIYIDTTRTSVIHVPSKDKKLAKQIAEDFIDVVLDERLDIGNIINYNPEFKIKVRECRNSNSLLDRIKRKW